LIPEELNPVFSLPFFTEDSEGLPVPNYPRGALWAWLGNISREAANVLEEEGFWETQRGESLLLAERAFANPNEANRNHLGQEGMAWILNYLSRDPEASARVQDALAVRFHAGYLQEGLGKVEFGAVHPSAEVWFSFGASCGLRLGAAASRLNLLPYEPDAKLGKNVRQGRTKGGRKTAAVRWKKTKPDREERNAGWIRCDDYLRETYPEMSGAERCRIIADKSKKRGLTGASEKNVSRVLRELRCG
jgi:hypothetical protein